MSSSFCPQSNIFNPMSLLSPVFEWKNTLVSSKMSEQVSDGASEWQACTDFSCVWFWRSPRMTAVELDFWSNKCILIRLTSFVWYYRRFQINSFQHDLILAAGWKFGFWRSKSRPRHRIPGQFSVPHTSFCPSYVPAFSELTGRGTGAGIYFDWCITPPKPQMTKGEGMPLWGEF